MMALFLCLWLTSQDQKIKDAVERIAFRNPLFSSVTKESVEHHPNKDAPPARIKPAGAPFTFRFRPLKSETMRRII